MHFSEISPGMVAQVVAARGARTKEFETKITEVDLANQTAKIEAICRDGKLVGFDIEGIILAIYIINFHDSRVYQFNNISIRSFRNPDGSLYQVVTFKTPEGKVANRRGAVRVWLGTEGKVVLGNKKEEHPVVIKDISATGISFVCDEDTEVEMGMPITLSFFDEKMCRPFTLNANVVRYADLEDHTRIVYGCRFSSESDAISRYVNEKQREKLKATRTVDSHYRG